MASFLALGAAVLEQETVTLSGAFIWYGADFVHPHRMPVLLPSRPRHALSALSPWLSSASVRMIERGGVAVRFALYDWGLRCAVR